MAKRAYRVLVADDEFWICEDLRHIIDWENYGLVFLEPASDGEEVIERVKKEKVDILITDINMPFKDGLALLKEIHDTNADIVTMVISGYDDFEKVKGAFMQGSINYLLKPINKTDLVNALSKAIEKRGEREAGQLQEEQKRIEAQKASSFLQDNEFSKMLLSNESKKLPNILMPCDMDIGGVNLIMIKFHTLSRLAQYYNHDMLWMSYSIKKKIKDTLNMQQMFIFNYSYRVNEFIICAELDEKKQKKIAEAILTLFPEKENGPITVVQGRHTFMMQNLKEAYNAAVAALMTRPFVPESVVITGEQDQREKMNIIMTKEQEKELSVLVAKGEQKGLENFIFHKIGLLYSQSERWSLLKTRQTVRKIMSQIAIEDSLGMFLTQSLNYDDLMERADLEVNELNLQQVVALFRELFSEITKDLKEEMTETFRDSIRKAIEYVNQNYCDNITLNDIAGLFHVEPTYFSKLFRQESGENLIPYISRKRIERAAGLIEKNEMSLTEIAFLVGYEDYGYFNRVFRKYKNTSPKEYRKACNGGKV